MHLGLHCKFQLARIFQPDDPKGIIMGDGLARNLGVSVGDQVVLLANTASARN